MKRGLKHCVENGKLSSKVPLGYVNVSDGAAIHTKVAPSFEQAFRLMVPPEATVQMVRAELTHDGLRSRYGNHANNGQLRKILSNSVFYRLYPLYRQAVSR